MKKLVFLILKEIKMNTKLIKYLEESFIGDLLKTDGVTDISFNGKSIFYMHNKLGRRKSDISVDLNYVFDFVRQVANLSEKQFSFTEPFLDVSVGLYRINAVHSSIVKANEEKSISFSIRISSKTNRIENDKGFMTPDEKEYLINLLKNKESIVIGGSTGSGKTELQKYLLCQLEDNSRIIVIDNIQELECLRENENLDITYWQVSPNMEEKTFKDLIRNALRSNPDWIVVSESRGKEMADILLSVMSGHPVITTLHSYNLEEMPNRMARMVQLDNQNQMLEDVKKDINSHFKNFVYLKRCIGNDNTVHRFIESIGRLDKGKMKQVFLLGE